MILDKHIIENSKGTKANYCYAMTNKLPYRQIIDDDTGIFRDEEVDDKTYE